MTIFFAIILYIAGFYLLARRTVAGAVAPRNRITFLAVLFLVYSCIAAGFAIWAYQWRNPGLAMYAICLLFSLIEIGMIFLTLSHCNREIRSRHVILFLLYLFAILLVTLVTRRPRADVVLQTEMFASVKEFMVKGTVEDLNHMILNIVMFTKFFREDVAMTAQTMLIGNKPCRIYGEAHAEYLLLQMTGEHEQQNMESEVAAIAQSAHHFLFAAIPVESWNDALSPWEAPAVWGKQGFGGKAANTLRFLTEQVIPTLKQQFHLPENVKIILGGYSLAGLFALWASTQTNLFYGVAAASPSVWFPGWMEFEQQHPIQAQHIYLSLGDKEERTKNAVMAVVGDNIRTLHSQLTECSIDCTLEWNSGGHFKDADMRTAKAFRWMMEEHT